MGNLIMGFLQIYRSCIKTNSMLLEGVTIRFLSSKEGAQCRMTNYFIWFVVATDDHEDDDDYGNDDGDLSSLE